MQGGDILQSMIIDGIKCNIEREFQEEGITLEELVLEYFIEEMKKEKEEIKTIN